MACIQTEVVRTADIWPCFGLQPQRVCVCVFQEFQELAVKLTTSFLINWGRVKSHKFKGNEKGKETDMFSSNSPCGSKRHKETGESSPLATPAHGSPLVKSKEDAAFERYLAMAHIAQRKGDFGHLTDLARHKAIEDESASEHSDLSFSSVSDDEDEDSDVIDEWARLSEEKAKSHKYPSLNILILIVGSRGDVQPFISFAQGLLQRVNVSQTINFA